MEEEKFDPLLEEPKTFWQRTSKLIEAILDMLVFGLVQRAMLTAILLWLLATVSNSTGRIVPGFFPLWLALYVL